MAVVTVQVGQAGNQLGHRFYEALYQDREYAGDSLPRPRQPSRHGNATTLPAAGDDGSAAAIDRSMGLDRHFDTDGAGRHMARAVMIDMESKVVRSGTRSGRRHRETAPHVQGIANVDLRPTMHHPTVHTHPPLPRMLQCPLQVTPCDPLERPSAFLFGFFCLFVWSGTRDPATAPQRRVGRRRAPEVAVPSGSELHPAARLWQ